MYRVQASSTALSSIPLCNDGCSPYRWRDVRCPACAIAITPIERHEVAWEQFVMDAFAARGGRAGQEASLMLDEVLP